MTVKAEGEGVPLGRPLAFDGFSQQKQGRHIGEHHTGVDQVRALPHESQGKYGPDIDHHNINHLIEEDPSASGQVFHGAFPEIGPADQSSYGEGYKTQG